MKFVIPTFERMEWMPPTIAMFQKLVGMGHEIVYITIFPDRYFAAHPLKKILNVALCNKEISLQKKLPYIRGISGILYRIDFKIRSLIAHRLRGAIQKEMDENSILWVVNEMTIMLGGRSFLKGYPYLFTIYELHEKNRKRANRNIEVAVRGAATVVVPEFCRAKIMQARYGLKRCPIVIPNKSDIPTDVELSNAAREAIYQIEVLKKSGKVPVLYIGGITLERPLEPMLEAIRDTAEYKLVVIGHRTIYLDQLMENYPDELVYVGGYEPPEHLAVASHCMIGLVIYVPINTTQAMNVLFCAPNKIYEYTGYGMPIIANDMPTLRFDLLANHMGEVADFSKTESIRRALERIMYNYSAYSANARVFYEQMDISQLLKNAIMDYQENR